MSSNPEVSCATRAALAQLPVPGVRFYRPRRTEPGPAETAARGRQAHASLPLVVHFHGGTFVSGSLDSGACIGSLLASAGALAISVDYPLAPEHPFPAAAEAGYAVLGWVQRYRRQLGGRDAAIYVAGEEAGGNIAAAVAIMARDRLGPALAGQILISPMLDASLGTASMRGANAGLPQCRWAAGWRGYLPRVCDTAHPYATPAAGSRVAGLPPLLLMTAGDDPLRDEGRAYARRLRKGGVPVSELLLPGSTGWPESLTQPPHDRSPWSDAVRARLFSFLMTHSARVR